MKFIEELKDKSFHLSFDSKAALPTGQLIMLDDVIGIMFRYREELIKAIPTTWLDSLLTGNDSVLPKSYIYNP